MNHRILQTFRENWDVGFIVTAIGLILGWALFIFLVSPLLGQTPVFENEVWKSAGDTIQVRWQYPTDPRVYQFLLLRCTVKNSCSIIAVGGPETREFNISMSSGTATRYYLRVRPVIINNGIQITGPSSTEMIVNRKP